MYFSAQEMLAQLEGTDERICDLVIKNEIELFQTSYDEIMKNLEERYQIMYNCAHDALEKEIRSLSGLTGGSALKMWNYYKKGNSICDNTVIRGAAYALSCLEVNASMGLIVAAPTAGACGILPGALLTVAEKYDVDIMTMTGFLDGIDDSLAESNPIEEMEEDTQVSLGFDKALLYKNMVAAGADWLYELEEWNDIF